MSIASQPRRCAAAPARGRSTDLRATHGAAVRTLAAGASSAMVLSLVATGAFAQPAAPAPASVGSVALTPEARAVLAVVPEVAVPDDATSVTVAVEASATATAAPEPEPEPAPAPEPVAAPAAQQRAERTAAPAPSAPAATGAGVAAAAPAATSESVAETAPASTTGGVVGAARSKVGAAYVWGASGPTAFDCSGFTAWVYAQAGYSLPHQSGGQRAWAQANGTKVSAAAAQPGDLMWWPGHVGVYVGNGMMVDAGTPATGVSERAVYGSPEYYRIG